MNTDAGAEHLMSNRHTAERKCRGLLLELKTYFLQMQSKLASKYGENSAIYKMYEDEKDDAKCKDISFALAMDLKECANHCNEIVHSFVSPDKKNTSSHVVFQLHYCLSLIVGRKKAEDIYPL